MNYPDISKNRKKELVKLKQKKYRLQDGLVVVEGLRTLLQLKEFGIQPLEQYLVMGEKPVWEDVETFQLKDWELGQICDSEHPQGVVALFTLPVERQVEFSRAFYLDGISDPGNLGTIFRVAAAFAIDTIFMSFECAEVSSPKVIRASLGSVFQVPFITLDPNQIAGLGAELFATQASGGKPLSEFHPAIEKRIVITLGSEAQGLSATVLNQCKDTISIEMQSGMESLNVSVAAGIIASHLYSG